MTLPASDEPEARAHALVERVAALLEECHALQWKLAGPREAGGDSECRSSTPALLNADRLAGDGPRPGDGGCAYRLAPSEPAALADGR